MIVSKGVGYFRVLKWSWVGILLLSVCFSAIAILYYSEIITIKIPWLPISVIGTAVAFFVGFKNNQAYDRWWEARKVWGGIINNSRTWGMQVDGYISDTFNDKIDSNELQAIKQRLIYRHLAWLYSHREQLLIAAPWEHISQGGSTSRVANSYQENFGIGLVKDEVSKIKIKNLVSPQELEELEKAKNRSTQLINAQSRDLRGLRKRKIIEDFRHIELMETLQQFYELQGKNERIKKTPFPRQYATTSRIFVIIFILLLPFSMIPELMTLGNTGLWLSVPITTIIAFVYLMMELTADYTENPFQGMANDIPMLSLCRTIEIDLRQMLGEDDLPLPIAAKDDILM
jgi:putative membrane protein